MHTHSQGDKLSWFVQDSPNFTTNAHCPGNTFSPSKPTWLATLWTFSKILCYITEISQNASLKYKDFSKPNFSTDITAEKLFDVTKYHFDIFPVFWYHEMFWADF